MFVYHPATHRKSPGPIVLVGFTETFAPRFCRKYLVFENVVKVAVVSLPKISKYAMFIGGKSDEPPFRK